MKIKIEAESMQELLIKLRPFKLEMEKIEKSITIGENADELILYVPKQYKGKNILIIYGEA